MYLPPPFQRVACACEEERIGVNHLLASQRRLHLRLLLLLAITGDTRAHLLLPRQLLLLLHSLQLLHQERRVVLSRGHRARREERFGRRRLAALTFVGIVEIPEIVVHCGLGFLQNRRQLFLELIFYSLNARTLRYSPLSWHFRAVSPQESPP